MKSTQKTVLSACAALVLCLAFSSLAAFAAEKKPEEVFFIKGDAWALQSGGEPEGMNGESEGMHWYAVDPENEEAAKGLKRGILLYNANTKAYSFLPTTEEQTRVEQVTFSPNKERMVVACNLNRFTSGLFVYDVATRKLEKSFWGHSSVWFVDDVRFVFTLTEQTVERPETAGMWATSAAIYEPANDTGYVVLKAASATESFTVTDANKDGITITATSVKAAKDWEDVEKQQDTEITIDIPAAG